MPGPSVEVSKHYSISFRSDLEVMIRIQLIKVLHFPQTPNAFEVDGILRSSFPPLGEQEWVVLYRARKG